MQTTTNKKKYAWLYQLAYLYTLLIGLFTLLMMFVIVVLMFANKVHAEQIYTEDITEEWVYQTTHPSGYAIEYINLELPSKPNTFYADMVNYGYSVSQNGTEYSTITIWDKTMNVKLYEEELATLFGVEDNDLRDGTIYINFQTGFIGKEIAPNVFTPYTDFIDLTNAGYVSITVFQSFLVSNPPPGWQAIWFTNTETIMTYSTIVVKFFALGTLVATTVWEYQGIDIPNDPTPPEDYYFIGWRTLDGDIFTEQSPILPTYFNNDGELILFARFVSMTGDELGIPEEPESNVPQGLAVFLDTFGLDNEVGYFLVFFLVNLIPLVLMILKKIPSFVFYLVSILLFVLGIYLGMFSVWVIITMGLIYVTAFSFIIKKYAFKEELSNEESA